MSLLQDSTGYYLQPSTGQYYEPAPMPAGNYNPFGFMGMGGFNSYQNNGILGMNQNRSSEPAINYLTVDGMRYKPFTGNADGISQGIRSMVDSSVANRQPYEYAVPDLAQMFQSQPQMQQMAMQPQGGDYGANRFLGGLIGTQLPTPISSETTTAPASSGAGRYL